MAVVLVVLGLVTLGNGHQPGRTHRDVNVGHEAEDGAADQRDPQDQTVLELVPLMATRRDVEIMLSVGADGAASGHSGAVTAGQRASKRGEEAGSKEPKRRFCRTHRNNKYGVAQTAEV